MSEIRGQTGIIQPPGPNSPNRDAKPSIIVAKNGPHAVAPIIKTINILDKFFLNNGSVRIFEVMMIEIKRVATSSKKISG